MKVAVAGFGVEGRASYDYWLALGNDVTIVDEKQPVDLPAGAKVKTGVGVFDELNDFDVVIRTPGLSPKRLKSAGVLWSATNEFFAVCPAPIIGVTGSKGKGTTSSLITSILRAAGKTVHLVGNIGAPALAELAKISPDDLVVYELSSFQLWDIKASPQVAVVLPIEPDHLDVHSDFEDYVQAKAGIARYQAPDGMVVFFGSNEQSQQIAGGSSGNKLDYSSDDFGHVVDSHFFYGAEELCPADELKLPGQHNLDNACAAITATWPWVRDGAVIAAGLRDFAGLPHRLAFVCEVNGVRFYDDSIATTPGSVIAVLKSFDQPKILIIGGHEKGSDYQSLADQLLQNNVKQLVLVGENAQLLAERFQAVNLPMLNLGMVPMHSVVQAVWQLTEPGDVVILSPAASSFDMYKDYKDRGKQFIAAVKELPSATA